MRGPWEARSRCCWRRGWSSAGSSCFWVRRSSPRRRHPRRARPRSPRPAPHSSVRLRRSRRSNWRARR
ncbi:MAG: hypothetical protein FJ381_08865 [Verrucomicrobia bacterium]|nr:hypothetical protein [Verrucomicrobiota bacterium]